MTHIVRTHDYELTLAKVREVFPDRFGPTERNLEAALALPPSKAKREPFVNPCPTVIRRPRGYVDPLVALQRFNALLKTIRKNWGLE